MSVSRTTQSPRENYPPGAQGPDWHLLNLTLSDLASFQGGASTGVTIREEERKTLERYKLIGKDQAPIDIVAVYLSALEKYPSVVDIVRISLSFLRPLPDDVMRKAIDIVLRQENSPETETPKIFAIARLVGLKAYVPDDIKRILFYAVHDRDVLRSATHEAIESLTEEQRMILRQAASEIIDHPRLREPQRQRLARCFELQFYPR